MAELESLITVSLLEQLVTIRHQIHQNPELSGKETQTADFVCDFLNNQSRPPSELLRDVGGTGIIATYDSGVDGPAVLFRAELDALPILEINDFAYKSCTPGVSHKCGHDGHMATLLGLGMVLASNKLKKGKIYLLFQPAEETGSGSAAMIGDSRFTSFHVDYVFAFHNIPEYPLGSIILRKGVFTASVRSLSVILSGKTSHAAEPENGISPSLCIAKLLLQLDEMSNNDLNREDFRVITPVHVLMGESGAFGVTPGHGEVHLTFRTWGERQMELLVCDLLKLIANLATQSHLQYRLSWTDIFVANENTDLAVDVLESAATRCSYPFLHSQFPMKWGEDFGNFTQKFAGSFFGIGAGTNHAALHNPDYDYPDEILESGLKMFLEVLRHSEFRMLD
jgi:amidohydrolase